MSQWGGGGYGYGSGNNADPYESREPGSRRKKLAAMAKSVYAAGVATASEIRNQYDNTRIRGVIDVDDSSYKVSIPGSFPDVAIVTRGEEEMVLFPSYAKQHVRQFRDDGSRISSYAEGDRGEGGQSNEDFWRNEWARMEDQKAVVDVDVRGWVYSPHRGPMTRKNRLLIGLARRLSGIPAPTQQATGQSQDLRTGYESHEDLREQQKIDKEAQEIERRGQAEKEAAVRGGYSEKPRSEDPDWEGRVSPDRSRSGSQTPGSVPPSPPSLASRPNNGTATAAELTEAELAVANANLMARLGPFLTTPKIELPVTLFFYNDTQSQSRTVETNDAGHFAMRAGLDFVPTHVRVLANEDLSTVQEIEVTDNDGVSIISDIDDTIKKSSISLGAREIFRNTFIRDLKDLTIEGVREWYGELYKMGVRFHYCSNSPWQLFPVIATYFRHAGLPPGSLHLKHYSGMLQGIFEPVAERKKGTLEAILRDFPGRRFILVGDSGEADLEVYTDLATSHPGRILAIFIRDVTTPEQTGYFDAATKGLSSKTSSAQLSVGPEARQNTRTDEDTLRPPLPPRGRSEPPKPEGPTTGTLIDFSDEPQAMNENERENLQSVRTGSSSVTDLAQLAARKKPPPPKPNKPASLKGESSSPANGNEQLLPGISVPPVPSRKIIANQVKNILPHPLAQTQNSSEQSPGGGSDQKTGTGSGTNTSLRGFSPSQNSSSPQTPSPGATSAKQPPPPPPPRRRVTPLQPPPSLQQQGTSPRGRQTLRHSDSNSDIEKLDLSGVAAATAATLDRRPLPPGRTATATTFDSMQFVSSTSGHNSNYQQSQQYNPVNKKLELWRRRLERAHDVLDREGVRLYTWRRGEDVVLEAVGIVREAIAEKEKRLRKR